MRTCDSHHLWSGDLTSNVLRVMHQPSNTIAEALMIMFLVTGRGRQFGICKCFKQSLVELGRSAGQILAAWRSRWMPTRIAVEGLSRYLGGACWLGGENLRAIAVRISWPLSG